MEPDREPPFSPADLAILAELRQQYLARSEDGEPGPLDRGWIGERELALYDATFGARIGWKWRHVLREIALRRIEPPRGLVLDFGCGTGVAARAWIEASAPEGQRVALWDRSGAARAFAARSLRARWPRLEVEELAAPPAALAPDVLLASHVLGELDDAATAGLVALASSSRFVAWVEPGARAISRRLCAAREHLRVTHAVLAPCTHALACGALAAGRERDWCHHVAPPDQAAFTTRRWRQLAEELGIDLRSLTLAFLVLGRGAEPAREPDAARILGRPRVEKGRALFVACTAEGLRDLQLLERTDRAFVRSLREPAAEPRLAILEHARGRVARLGPLAEPEPWRAG